MSDAFRLGYARVGLGLLQRRYLFAQTLQNLDAEPPAAPARS
jgi:hypothetical protein